MTSVSRTRPPLADAHAVERPQDRVRQPVLLPGALREVLRGQLLEAVRRDRRGRGRAGRPRASGRRSPTRRPSTSSRTTIRSSSPAPVRLDRGVEGGGEDPLVLGQQVVGELVEVADPADHRGRRHDLVAVRRQLAQQRRRPWRRPPRTGSAGGRRSSGDVGPYLLKLSSADHLVAGLEQLRHEVAVDEPGGAGDQDPHQSRIPPPERAPDVHDLAAAEVEVPVGPVRGAQDQDVALREDRRPAARAGRRATYGSVHRTRAPAHASSLRSL